MIFAALAALSFLLALLGVTVEKIDFVVLGLLFIACHLIFPVGPVVSIPRRTRG